MIWEDRLIRHRLAPVVVQKTSVFPGAGRASRILLYAFGIIA
jgi:hypothetical protein